ncbi:DUF6243 family protein [Streptomyces clavuligerus]|uniref:Uncharacterized protein n=1 Tax=Streptomyces clavuligerus TaxID=1901 RepID=E2Q319_STRCL|nr:DUF6243 family protein [Streptomyces clavuligerus]ANW20293.1 hypothetical protein BB341_19795 [Streptomyces clavuligerus]AXU14921.1 hypothetical protein D1794_20620 [Streptomyces clavuligerus]EFG06772.1 Hypothetical protein SCLAV_1697 [Streptomyces clavuligerus]MBY6304962.1 hypothetical protein [Streptomyces clavuligerus]QCS07693.1 hypothetical protein CRV15_19985 [Streptomyces clavuligerus]
MAKSRNNLLGVGGQRKKLSRADQQGNGPSGQTDRKNAADQKAELLRRMRERSGGTAAAAGTDGSTGASGPAADGGANG